ncbi:DJ-1 family glyoxalase III [Enorma phocaeensis]|uniref:DJ-1/PfpI family protein n=1 Tax=Enorma phocaeensis TaxID=1871019 RepID=A0ABT7V7D0_9ACTN|nr:DJ-1 family glyoxalase III [Enorma phocaeensis]MBM6953418.1 DJ-1/PfpI family protein [Enorma phocaeensis]MDM8274406.1 DJ-1/PfpI family protein [Enorma phocaeensis]
MSAVAILVADGFETIECLTILDVLRRGGVRASLVSVMATREAVSAQQVNIVCDYTLDEVDMSEYDYIVLPGGMPGTTNLRRDQRVCDLVSEFASTKHVAAICAAPSILGELGLLIGRKATCFPGFESSFPAGTFAGPKTVVVDGNIITASAMGQALPFALAVLEDIAGKKAVEKVREGIQL